jgi:hypothetical protein
MSTAVTSLPSGLNVWTPETAAPAAARNSAALREEPAAPFRFTLDGSDALEQHLAQVCGGVGESVRALIPASKLEGILLAGGYGRGEGGVLKGADGDMPYNDMEFYVFIKGSTLLNDRLYREALHDLGVRLSPKAGLDVEFKILSLASLKRSKVTMFSYDFVTRHHWVVGDDSLLNGCEHHLDASAIPAYEATRLLFNRCSGLLYASERLRRSEFTAEDADFVGRNLAKAQLGIGDAVLAAAGHYHASCLKRHGKLVALQRGTAEIPPSLGNLARQHEPGVFFKLRPYRSAESREELQVRLKRLSDLARNAWLHLESTRLQRHFSNPADYALSPFNKCPEVPTWKNLLVTIRTFGPSAILKPDATRYPRERLFKALALLLWTDCSEPATQHVLQQTLRTSATDFTGFVKAYEQLWHQFN